MEMRLWTVHRKGEEVRFIPDGFSIFALALPPVWVIWHGAWITLIATLVLAGAAAMYNPLAASPVMYGIGLILAFEGAQIRRWEMRLRGWQEVSVVQAQTVEGAEELWLAEMAAPNSVPGAGPSPWLRPPAHRPADTLA
ncbi:MAG: DUF2628 domain-containing protein [Pseudomonadota bacterium]